VAAVVTELRRAGIDDHGCTIAAGMPPHTRLATYQDHRMAMSLSLRGLWSPGIEIADPGCVAKTSRASSQTLHA
jgi:3-phosphoshikimate 1-carboxyvinyltransferase